MDNNGFKMCVDCANKQFVDLDTDGRAMYYCAIVDGIVSNGIVYDSTDATDCIKCGLFKFAYNSSHS